jgi:hypothetical protein
MIGSVMGPSFQQQVRPALPNVLHHWYYAAATIHALLGVTAEFSGLYIVIVAGTSALPQWLRFKDWTRWMRTELMLVGCRAHRCGDLLRMVHGAIPLVPAPGDLSHICPILR